MLDWPHTELKLTLGIECNAKPKLDAVNDAIARRLFEIPFQSRFVEQYVYDELSAEEKTTTFLSNQYYKSIDFQMQFRQALFMILIPYFKAYKQNGLVVPQVVRKRNEEYMAQSDDIYDWLNNEFEKQERHYQGKRSPQTL
jgi:phage/plasmid-associated DNA primase